MSVRRCRDRQLEFDVFCNRSMIEEVVFPEHKSEDIRSPLIPARPRYIHGLLAHKPGDGHRQHKDVATAWVYLRRGSVPMTLSSTPRMPVITSTSPQLTVDISASSDS